MDRLAICDLDGILWGDLVHNYPPKELWHETLEFADKIVIYTNDVTFSKANRLDDLFSVGIDIDCSLLTNPCDVFFDYLQSVCDLERTLFLGRKESLESDYLNRVAGDVELADSLVLGDTAGIPLDEVQYLTKRAISKGIPVFTLNENRGLSGRQADLGDALVPLLATLKCQRHLVGKPNIHGFQYILERHSLTPAQVVYLTDSIHNDGYGAILSRIKTVDLSAGPRQPSQFAAWFRHKLIEWAR